MRIGHSQHDYDRESEYWRDIEEAQSAQIEAQKNLPKAATNGKSEKFKNDSGILPHQAEGMQSGYSLRTNGSI